MTLKTSAMRFLLTAGAVVAVGAGIAYAAVPGSGGVINGCYEKRTGLLRVIDAEAGKRCLSFETPISWNQQGPKGDPGAQGIQGLRGEQGEPGPASLSALGGTACTRADGSPGSVEMNVSTDDVVTIRCQSSGGGGGGGGTATQALVVTPTSLNFGMVPVSTVSATRRVTVTNPNDVSVGLTVATGSFVFRFVSRCGTALAAHASCLIDVSFAPVVEAIVGSHLTIDASPLSVAQVNLMGAGVA